MESMLVGSFHKPSFPFPFAAQLCSFPGAGSNLKCKSISNVERPYAMPEKLCLWRQNLMQQHVKNIGRRIITLNPKGDLKYVVNTASGHSLESEPCKSPGTPVQQTFDAFYRFSRPHTVIGTALCIISVSLLAVEKLSDFSTLFFAGLFEAIVAALLMNIYIVGLNQISDIEFDKWMLFIVIQHLDLNIPETITSHNYELLLSHSQSFCLGWIVGSWPLLWALFISFMLGTAYSIDVPLFRWKRFAVVAAMCCARSNCASICTSRGDFFCCRCSFSLCNS